MITQFRHFVAIIDHGGVSNAANAINLSQPALSRSLKSLEERLNGRLLDRRRGKPILTEMGRLLLPRARTLLIEQAAILNDVKALQDKVGMATYVNSSPAVAISLLTETIAEVARSEPHLRISIRGDNGTNNDWKVEALRSGKIDIAISIALRVSSDEGFVHEPLMETDLRIATVPGEGIDKSTQLADLLDRRWILPPRSSSGRKVIENEFNLLGLPFPHDTVEISDWRMALIVARESSAVVTLPYHPACFKDLFGLKILPIEFRTRPLPLNLIYRQQVKARPAAKAFINAIKSIVARSSEL